MLSLPLTFSSRKMVDHTILLDCVVSLIFLGVVRGAGLYGPQCLNCQGVIDPTHCTETTLCWASQECYSEHMIHANGSSWYNFGCKIEEECRLIESSAAQPHKRLEPVITVCEKCCDTDVCNIELCSNVTASSTSCFVCENQDNPKSCRSLKHCDSHEACYAEAVIDDNPLPKHSLGCMGRRLCDYLEPHRVGRRSSGSFVRHRRRSHICQKCCYTAGCNADLCSEHQVSVTTAPTSSEAPQHTTTESHTSPNSLQSTVEIPSTTEGTTGAQGGALRLVNGNSPSEGRLEIFHEGIWGTVCGDDFTPKSAQVACRELGIPSVGPPQVHPRAHFGQGSGKIWLDNVVCRGDEFSLSECSHNAWGSNNCNHNEDVGISCSSGDILRLVNGNSSEEGRLEIFHDGIWGTVCDDDFHTKSAQVACRQLGLPSAGAVAYHSAPYGQGSDKIWLDNVICRGDESALSECSRNPWGHHNCHHIEDVGVICSSLALRLVNGSSSEGRLEILQDGIWGTICDDNFGTEEARVACRALGLPSGAVTVFPKAHYGQGNGKIWLDDLNCRGDEPHLSRCNHAGWGVNNCHHSEDVGVRCRVS